MSGSKTKPDDVEAENAWHALPIVLGNIIEKDEPGYTTCGGYLVTKEEDGRLEIYREIDSAVDVDELETEGDRMVSFGDDFVTGNEHVATIPAPEGGWGSETKYIGEDLWQGFR